jgi:hypothetical protein
MDSGKIDKVIVLSGMCSKELCRICDILGFEIENIYVMNRLNLLRAILYSLKWFLMWNIMKVVGIKICGVPCADFLADYIIRCKEEVFNVNKIRVCDLRLCVSFARLILNIKAFFEKNNPSFFLTHETGYWYGAVIKLAEKMKSQLIQCTAGNRIIVFGETVGLSQCPASLWHFEVEEALKEIDRNNFDYISWADNYYEKRSKGLTDEAARTAYVDRVDMDRKTWIEKNGVDPNKKNIVIMAHCFSDCANTATEKSVFKNYYEWLVGTLDIIKEIDNVNWILKAHPSRHIYHEGDGIYEIFNRYKKDNVYVLEDSISSNTVLKIADAVITVMGTCGMEYPAHGIPAVCAGYSMYGHLGITIDAENYNEYKKILSNLDKIEPLSKDEIDKAKKISCAYFSLHNAVDRFDQYFVDAYNYPVEDGNNYLLRKIIDDFENNITLKSSMFYVQGLLYKEEGKRCLAITKF